MRKHSAVVDYHLPNALSFIKNMASRKILFYTIKKHGTVVFPKGSADSSALLAPLDEALADQPFPDGATR